MKGLDNLFKEKEVLELDIIDLHKVVRESTCRIVREKNILLIALISRMFTGIGGGMISESIPTTMSGLILEGAGWENLHIKTLPVPIPNENQLLAKVDCAGVCTSLLKIIQQGSNHLNVWAGLEK